MRAGSSSATLATPLRRPHKRTREARFQIPIVDRNRRLAGWTRVDPDLSSGFLRHAEAEKLVDDRVMAAYLQIDDAETAALAGAPPGWKGPWRCLGLCAESVRPRQISSGEIPTIEVARSAGGATARQPPDVRLRTDSAVA